MTLGSLFDGIGGFPLAAAAHGIRTLWVSDIDPACETVTRRWFPDAAQLGDITQIDGTKIKPVDIITGGSPCQDLSVAGKRAGLEGVRSGLFVEMMRIVREMRGATDNAFPRYVVWENVPGAFSSNGGEDFRVVVVEFCKLADPGVSIPRPSKWSKAGCVMGDGYSFAYRTIDAKFWGVPQRRRRIFAVLDLGGQCASKILFVEKGVRRDSAPGGAAGEGAAADVEGGAGGSVCSFMGGQGDRARNIAWAEDATPPLKAVPSGGNTVPTICFQACGNRDNPNLSVSDKAYCLPSNPMSDRGHIVCLNPHDAQTQRIYDANGIYPCLPSNESGGLNRQAVCCPIDSHQQDGRYRICLDGIMPTLPGQMGTGGNNGPMVMQPTYTADNGQAHMTLKQETASTLNCMHDQQIVLHSRNRRYIVRRLTPTECERLQGFPDGWTDIPHKGKSMSDSARYRMLGNSVAVPCVEFVMGGIAREVLNG